MTLIKYSLKDKDTFKAIECSSALIPCSFEERIYLTSVYDIFAYLYVSSAFFIKISMSIMFNVSNFRKILPTKSKYSKNWKQSS